MFGFLPGDRCHFDDMRKRYQVEETAVIFSTQNDPLPGSFWEEEEKRRSCYF